MFVLRRLAGWLAGWPGKRTVPGLHAGCMLALLATRAQDSGHGMNSKVGKKSF